MERIKIELDALARVNEVLLNVRRAGRVLLLLEHRSTAMPSEDWDDLVRWTSGQVRSLLDSAYRQADEEIGSITESLISLMDDLELDYLKRVSPQFSPRVGNTGVELTDLPEEYFDLHPIDVDQPFIPDVEY